MSEVSFKNVYKVYPAGIQAVNDFSLTIRDKEFIVLVGPSGCGKSTVLRMIAGLEDVTMGELTIDGKDVSKVKTKDRGVAMVFQNYTLFPHMTVYDNIAFGLNLARNHKNHFDNDTRFNKESYAKSSGDNKKRTGTDNKTIKEQAENTIATPEKVRSAAAMLGLSGYLNRKPKALSGGQKQRVALARALVSRPRVFLLDEPLSNLDTTLRYMTRGEIIKLHEEMQTTFVYVTHDQVEAMTMGTRIVVLKDGFIQQADTPYNLYNYPANKFVAGFIGTPQMNFFDTELVFDNECGKYYIDFCGKKIGLSDELTSKIPTEYLESKKVKKIILGIRPDNIKLSPDNLDVLNTDDKADKSDLKKSNDKKLIKKSILDTGDCFVADATVTFIEELGGESNIHANLNRISVNTSDFHIILKTAANHGKKRGQLISIAFDKKHFKFFDKESENNIMLFAKE